MAERAAEKQRPRQTGRAQRGISIGGLLVLFGLYLRWAAAHRAAGLLPNLAALASVLLYARICLGLVPRWLQFWSKAPASQGADAGAEKTPRHLNLYLFLGALACDGAVLLLVFGLRWAAGQATDFAADLDFWRCTDSQHYLNIAAGGYLSAGSVDRLVELVFLPGYPLAVRLFAGLLGGELKAGLAVSALSFAGASCVFYHLLRLDYPHRAALRAVKYLWLLPGLFFFVSPLSESLFLLLSLSCLYCVRTNRWAAGCLLGGYAAFTRSLGIVLLVPVVFELVHGAKTRARGFDAAGSVAGKAGCATLIPAGFLAYCFINYRVSGNPFQFSVYQSEHWGQRLGAFFNTACYQMQNAIQSFSDTPHDFWGLWLPNILAFFFALVLLCRAAAGLRPSYTAWFLAYFTVSMGTTWLLSAPRYLAALPVIPAGCMLVTGNRRADRLLTAALAAASALYLCAFVMRWQVW